MTSIDILTIEVQREQQFEKESEDRRKLKKAVKNILASIKRGEKAVADYQKRVDDDKKALAELTLETAGKWQHDPHSLGGLLHSSDSPLYSISYASSVCEAGQR